MTKALTAGDAARLLHDAARQRADGSRGLRARRAWRRLVRACAAGDPAAQDAVRAAAADLSDEDALDVAAAAPEESTDRAVYLALVGQYAQRQALDPDGSLLALAYRAATPEGRTRLRTVMAAEGDGEVIRVVVTGDRRDRTAELSYDELDYLGHQLAERQDWSELHRLTRDLPLAKAAAAARLLPVTERTGRVAELLSGAASPEQLQALVDRLPRDPLITHEVDGRYQGASFSPDTSEVALRYTGWKWGVVDELRVETLRISTGEATRVLSGAELQSTGAGDSILHLGDEVLVRLETRDRTHQIVRILPRYERVGPPVPMSGLRRASRGAVVLCSEGPTFVDPGAVELRHQSIPRFTKQGKGGGGVWKSDASCALTTLPAARLIACCNLSLGSLYVANEDGKILHTMSMLDDFGHGVRFDPALSFLSPRSLAVHQKATLDTQQTTEIWEFTPHGTARRTARQLGSPRNHWPLEQWRVPDLDNAFASRVYRSLLALTPGQDMSVVSRSEGGRGFEVHSPHLPTARALLEQPLLHTGPHDVQRVRELRPKIGDPAVRDALDLLAACLTERFGGDIALGATGSSPFGGPHDIALGEGGKR